MTQMPEQGQQLPDVDFITEDQDRISAEDLIGRKIVLYFYPKDDTPGCTAEACSFRDRMSESRSAYDSSEYFREKHNLNFPLLTTAITGLASRATFLWTKAQPKVYPEVCLETHADEILGDALI